MPILITVLRVLFGAVFVFAGVSHFQQPEFWVAIVPPYLPWPLALVYLSGVAEIVLGLLVMIPRTARLAAWGLIALLVAVFPANLHMAMNPAQFPDTSPSALRWRLPLQLVPIAVAYLFTRRRPDEAEIADFTQHLDLTSRGETGR